MPSPDLPTTRRPARTVTVEFARRPGLAPAGPPPPKTSTINTTALTMTKAYPSALTATARSPSRPCFRDRRGGLVVIERPQRGIRSSGKLIKVVGYAQAWQGLLPLGSASLGRHTARMMRSAICATLVGRGLSSPSSLATSRRRWPSSSRRDCEDARPEPRGGCATSNRRDCRA